jgi:GMP synthase-like glutamine amidotransferase
MTRRIAGEADPARLLFVQNCPEEGIGAFADRLQELGVPWICVHAYAGERLPSLDHFDAVIVGGTPVSVNAISGHEFLVTEARWLRRALDVDKPVLGICFGGQLLARLLGGAVRKNPVMEIGSYPVSLTSAGCGDFLFQGFPRAFPAFHWHGETFEIPPWGMHLASGRDCLNQAFRMGSAVGLQFHLETTAEDARRWSRSYAHELRHFPKNRAQVVGECRAHEPQMAGLAARLVDNFLAGIHA